MNLPTFIEEKLKEFEGSNRAYMEDHSCCFNFEHESNEFRKALIATHNAAIEASLGKIVPEETKSNIGPQSEWNTCRLLTKEGMESLLIK